LSFFDKSPDRGIAKQEFLGRGQLLMNLLP